MLSTPTAAQTWVEALTLATSATVNSSSLPPQNPKFEFRSAAGFPVLHFPPPLPPALPNLSSSSSSTPLAFAGDYTVSGTQFIEDIFPTYNPWNNIIPQWKTLTLSANAVLTTRAWNPTTNRGGVVMFKANSVVFNSGSTIHANAVGYPGQLMHGSACHLYSRTFHSWSLFLASRFFHLHQHSGGRDIFTTNYPYCTGQRRAMNGGGPGTSIVGGGVNPNSLAVGGVGKTTPQNNCTGVQTMRRIISFLLIMVLAHRPLIKTGCNGGWHGAGGAGGSMRTKGGNGTPDLARAAGETGQTSGDVVNVVSDPFWLQYPQMGRGGAAGGAGHPTTCKRRSNI